MGGALISTDEGGHGACVTTFTATCLVGWDMRQGLHGESMVRPEHGQTMIDDVALVVKRVQP
jgi:hypothetical protein